MTFSIPPESGCTDPNCDCNSECGCKASALVLIKRPQINATCTGCFYKWLEGLCPENARRVCKAEKIIFKKAKVKK